MSNTAGFKGCIFKQVAAWSRASSYSFWIRSISEANKYPLKS